MDYIYTLISTSLHTYLLLLLLSSVHLRKPSLIPGVNTQIFKLRLNINYINVPAYHCNLRSVFKKWLLATDGRVDKWRLMLDRKVSRSFKPLLVCSRKSTQLQPQAWKWREMSRLDVNKAMIQKHETRRKTLPSTWPCWPVLGDGKLWEAEQSKAVQKILWVCVHRSKWSLSKLSILP